MNYSDLLSKLKNKKMLLYLAGFGVLLMLFGMTGTKDNTKEVLPVTELERIDVKSLERILETVEGAGKVKVFITYNDSTEKVPASNIKEVRDDGKSTKETNIITDKGEPYIVKKVSPTVRGILVTATGASSEAIKIRLLKSVKGATGVQSSKIHIEKAG